MDTLYPVVDFGAAARIRTMTEAAGFRVDRQRLHELCSVWDLEKQALGDRLMDEYDLWSPSSRADVALALGWEPKCSQKDSDLRKAGELGALVADWRRASRLVRTGAILFDRIRLTGGHLTWRWEDNYLGRWVAKDYGVATLPREIRATIKPTRGMWLLVDYPELEHALWAGLSGWSFWPASKEPEDSLFFFHDSFLLGATTRLPGWVPESHQSFRESFQAALEGVLVRAQAGSLTTLGGRPCACDEGLERGYQPLSLYTHGSCQDLLDSVAVRLFRTMEGVVEVAFIDHHAVLLDVPEGFAPSGDAFEEAIRVQVGEAVAGPVLHVGTDWGAVTVSRGDNPALYGYLP